MFKSLLLLATLFASPAFGAFLIPDNGVTVPKLHTSNVDARELKNCSLATSVSSNALTIALKNAAGADASTTSPCRIAFRNATLSTGTVAAEKVTAALSLVITSGSTLGHASGATHYIYVYAINSGSGVVLGASTSIFPDEGALMSTTAEGGSGGADSAAVVYTASAQTSKPFRLIGRLKVVEATAGTWATNASEIANWPFALKVPHLRATNTAGTSYSNGVQAVVPFATESEDNYNMFASGIGTVPMDGIYLITCQTMHSGNSLTTGNTSDLSLIAGGSTVTRDLIAGNGNNTGYSNKVSFSIRLAAGANFGCYLTSNGTGISLNSGGGYNTISVTWIAP